MLFICRSVDSFLQSSSLDLTTVQEQTVHHICMGANTFRLRANSRASSGIFWQNNNYKQRKAVEPNKGALKNVALGGNKPGSQQRKGHCKESGLSMLFAAAEQLPSTDVITQHFLLSVVAGHNRCLIICLPVTEVYMHLIFVCGVAMPASQTCSQYNYPAV